MNIMVVGGGGREHAIIRKLRENPQVNTIWALPGNAGMVPEAELVSIGATDLDGICDFAKQHPVDYAVVAPDDPLAMGLVDRLSELGIPCFGPSAAAAQIEASKVFAKDLMRRYGIPTAAWEAFDSAEKALQYLEACDLPIVIKADGLALGKGVIIAETRESAREAVHSIMEEHAFGKSGDRVVIEEFLTGPEVSVLAFTDSHTIVPMVSSMDHKRALDGDKGLNTGGMGTVAPNPAYTPELAKRCMEEIFLPTVRAMNAEGRPFKGCLYFGLMMTPKGPRVIEYNCRFGDPETQVVLPLLKTDLLTVMQSVTEERLHECSVEFSGESACCVILASPGYPGHYPKGIPVRIPEEVRPFVYSAGLSEKDGQLVTSGGRVLGVTAVAPTLRDAISSAYEMAETIDFPDAHMRHDIGQRALKALEK